MNRTSPKDSFIVQYDVKGAKSQRQFPDIGSARRFVLDQNRARRNPRLLKILKRGFLSNFINL